MDFKNGFSGKSFSLQKISAACTSNTGRKRKNNEDNFLFNGQYMPVSNGGLPIIIEREFFLRKKPFFAVFDGMGGGDYGEIASFTAVRTINEFLSGMDRPDNTDLTHFFTELCQTANQAVYRSAQKLESETMGTTLAGLYFYAGQVWACNLGDSRTYLLRDGKLRQISEDHTDRVYMQENGITGRKPYLTQYLGMDSREVRIVPCIKNISLLEGDRFLICSDGLTDMVRLQRLQSVMQERKKPKWMVSRMVEAALDAGGKDNITVIVIST